MTCLLLVLLVAVGAAAAAEDNDGQCAIQLARQAAAGQSAVVADTAAPPREKDGDGDLVKALLVGDYGSTTSLQAAVAASMEHLAEDFKPSVVLALGDNVYPNGAGSHEEIVDKVQLPFLKDKPALHVPWLVLAGNHDWRQDPLMEVNFTHSPASLGYWQFPHLWHKRSFHTCRVSVDIFLIDTMIWRQGADTHRYLGMEPQAVYQQQVEWLTKELSESAADWKVVAGHHPLYTTGGHFSGALVNDGMALLDRTLRQHGVVLYLAGHNHIQEYIQYEGMHYVTTGNGAKWRWWERQNFDSHHVPHGAPKDFSRIFDKRGGFASMTFESAARLDVVLRDSHGKPLPRGSFTIKNEPVEHVPVV